MKDVNFGLGLQLDHALEQKEPAVALRESTVLLTWGEGDDLRYRLGAISGAAVNFHGSAQLATGVQSSCALARSQGRVGNLYAVELHKSEAEDQLYSMAGRVSGTTVLWQPSKRIGSGKRPSIAMNNSLYVVEAHADSGKIHAQGGEFTVARNSEEVTWLPSANGDLAGDGENPSIAVNASGQVVLAWQSGDSLRFRLGNLNAGVLSLRSEVTGPDGSDPSVALTDDGVVILTFSDQHKNLHHLVGSYALPRIFAAGTASVAFDQGRRVSVASHGGVALHFHQSENRNRLYYSSSLVTDRGSWMGDRLATLGAKNLRQLALPASHDAGLYRVVEHDPTGAAKTQNLSIFGQLSNGIRYFDLRPRWNQNDLRFDIYHDIANNGDTIGPPLSEVLDDVARFMAGRRELAILKFSHYQNFEADSIHSGDPASGTVAGETEAAARARRAKARYRRLTSTITGKLSHFFYSKPASESRRLAQIPLRDYLQGRNNGVALVVCDGQLPVDNPAGGIYVYRDTDAPAEPKGDLRVYDKYFPTAGKFYGSLVNDQVSKFASYRGGDDLFLLSWTLTPIPGMAPTGETVLELSAEPNSKLGEAIGGFKNDHQQIVNLVYVNYVEQARVTDVCLYLNGVPQPPTS